MLEHWSETDNVKNGIICLIKLAGSFVILALINGVKLQSDLQNNKGLILKNRNY